MKGPHLRLKFDFRRRWECPECHAKARSGGQVTSMQCACGQKSGKTVMMRMTYDGEPMLPWRDQVPVASVATPAGEIAAEEEPSRKMPAAEKPTAAEEIPPVDRTNE